MWCCGYCWLLCAVCSLVGLLVFCFVCLMPVLVFWWLRFVGLLVTLGQLSINSVVIYGV